MDRGDIVVVPPSPDEQAKLIERYLPLWRSIFEESERMTPNERNRRIREGRASIDCTTEGCGLRIRYTVIIDWLEISDSFTLRILVGDRALGSAPQSLPKNVYLDEAGVRRLAADPLSQSFHHVPPVTRLAFRSHDEAVAAMKRASGFQELAVRDPMLPRWVDGDLLVLQGRGTRDRGHNRCVTVNANLVSGQVTVHDTPCVIY